MEEKIKTKKGFIQIPILIAIIVSVVVTSGIGYGAIEYHKTSKIIKEAEQLAKEEKYDEAIGKLEIAQNKFLGKTILKQKITAELEINKKLLEDKTEYTQGIEEFNKGNWEKAKELLSKVSENSPYYQDAKNKIEEAQKKIIEEKVAEIVKKETERAKKNIMGVEPEKKGYQASEIFEMRGKFIVYITCRNIDGEWKQGSGIVYGVSSKNGRKRSVILTNYHVIEGAGEDREADVPILKYPCTVMYPSDLARGKNVKIYYAVPIFFPDKIPLSAMQQIDFGFLRIEEETSVTFEVVPNASLIIAGGMQPKICNSKEVKIGDEIIVLGYPKIGGTGLTITEGIISGFDTDYYIVTSAKIEEGHSGGGAFLKSTGCLVGMPTFVRLGKIESFARLINISYLQENYLLKLFQ